VICHFACFGAGSEDGSKDAIPLAEVNDSEDNLWSDIQSELMTEYPNELRQKGGMCVHVCVCMCGEGRVCFYECLYVFTHVCERIRCVRKAVRMTCLFAFPSSQPSSSLARCWILSSITTGWYCSVCHTSRVWLVRVIFVCLSTPPDT